MGGLLRLVLVMLGASIVLVGGSMLVGSLSQAVIATGYHDNEGELFTVYTEDMARDLRLSLAGTRCFSPLPPWVYNTAVENADATPDIGYSFSVGDDRGMAAVERLRC